MAVQYGSQLSTDVMMDADPLSPTAHHIRPVSLLHTNNFNSDASMDAIAGRPPTGGPMYPTKKPPTSPENRTVHLSEAQDSHPSIDQRQSIVKKSSSYEDDDNDSSYSSYSSGCNVSTLPSVNWEQEIGEFRDKMPPHLKIPFIDVLILYAEEDQDKALEFRRHLIEDIDIGRFGRVKAELYDGEMFSLQGTKLGHLEQAYERSTYTFMLMTKNFVGDTWMTLSSESCLMDSIQSEEKRWCIVPVYTVKRSGNRPFKIPMGLNALKGINYYSNDEFYRNGVAKLIGDKVNVRLNNEEKLKIQQKQWVEKHKRDQKTLAENQYRTQMFEEQATRKHEEFLRNDRAMRIQQGMLPNMHPSMSDSQLSSSDSGLSQTSSQDDSLTHSISSGSLKPIRPNVPFVTNYFNDMTIQNQEALSHPRQRISGHPDNLPGNGVSPSYSRGEQQPMAFRRSPSTASTDMPPSFPEALLEKIKDFPLEKQNKFKQQYIESFQKEQHANQSSQIQYIQKSHSGFQNPNLNEIGDGFQPSDISLNPASLQSGGYSNEHQTGNLPGLSMLAESGNYQSRGTSITQGTRLGTFSESSGSSYSTGGESNRMDGPVSTLNTGLDYGNVPNSSLFTDCGSFPGPQSSIKGDNRGLNNKGGSLSTTQKTVATDGHDESDDVKKTKDGKQIIQKHYHYTYNVVGAQQVQIGNDGVITNTRSNTEGESSSSGSEDEKSADDTDSKNVDDTKSKATRFEKERVDATKDKTEMMAAKSKSPPASLKQGELAVESLPDQQQHSSAQMMDAAMSSVGSNMTAHMGSVSPTIMEKTQPVSVLTSNIKVEEQLTTEKLPLGMEKLLKPSGNTPNEKTPPKDKKINLPEGRRSPISPVPMATVPPMKQGPKESEETNLKKVADTDQTNLKTYASTNTQSSARPKDQGQQSRPMHGQSSNNQCQLLTTARPNKNCDKSDSKSAKPFEFTNLRNPSSMIYNNQFDEIEGYDSLDAGVNNHQLPSNPDGSQAQGGAVATETSMPDQSQGFIPTTVTDPMDDGDLEYDFIDDHFDGASFAEEVGHEADSTSDKKKGKRKGPPKECVVS